MIDRSHELPLTRQAQVLGPSRNSLYYQPEPVSPADLAITGRMDELHMDYPFAGSRMLRDLLLGEGVAIGRAQPPSNMLASGGLSAHADVRWQFAPQTESQGTDFTQLHVGSASEPD